MQVLIPKEIEAAKKGQVSYEIQWTIQNWREVRQDVNLVRNQKAIFKTGLQPTQLIQTKWLVGLKEVGRKVKVYWQLLDIEGPGSQPLQTLDAQIYTTLLCARSYAASQIDIQRKEISLGEIIEEQEEYLDIGYFDAAVDSSYINSNGEIQYKLVLTFKMSDDDQSGDSPFKRLKLEQFSQRSHDQLRENQKALLNQASGGDLKIVTRDGVELRAHQTILKAQCPVFAGMLNCDLSEAKTGIVKMDDISGKTMEILLHYFYTGDLLNGWNDKNSIVEFTYAAAKFQMTQILDLLDDLFGTCDRRKVTNLDVQLLNLCGKLSLKHAEARLLRRVIGKVNAAKLGKDLFKLFGFDKNEISRKAEMLAGGQSGQSESKMMEIIDQALKSDTNSEEDFYERGLNMLAFVQRNGSKTLEKTLLKRFAKITSRFTSAEELFALFGEGHGK